MTAPRLEACYFGNGYGNQWPRLARVLEHSARAQLQDWTVNVRDIASTDPALRNRYCTDGNADNTHKLQQWSELVDRAEDGDRILLIDADAMILRPLDDVWERSFDVAYTVREPGRFPFNAGVIFVRVSDESRAFFKHWLDINMFLLRTPAVHRVWRKRFGGMNQAALGALLEEGIITAKVVTLPCVEWNCEDSSWPLFAPELTRIVHVKSGLRRAVFNMAPRFPEHRRLATIWQQLERAAVAQGAAATHA